MNKSDYKLPMFLFGVVFALDYANIITVFIETVMKNSSYEESYRMTYGLYGNYVSNWHTSGFGAFLTWVISIGIVIVPILLGFIACLNKNKNMALISVLVLDVIAVLNLLTRFFQFGTKKNFSRMIEEYYNDSLKLSAEAFVIIVCVIAITATLLTMQKEAGIIKVNNPIGGVASASGTLATANNVNPVEEIKKLKELLDMEIITQEEFDAKKKQLL